MIDQNLEAFIRLFPEGEEHIRSKYQEYKKEKNVEISVGESYSGEKYLSITREKQTFLLGGKRSPRRVARKWGENFKNAQPGAFVFLAGLGNPYYAMELDEKLTKEASVLIYEPSIEVFFCILENFDLRKLLESKRNIVYIIGGINDDLIEKSVESIININMLPYMAVTVCPNYELIFTEELSVFLKHISRVCETVRVGLNTNIRFMSVHSKNVFHGALHVNRGYKTKQFTEFIPREIPTFIVGAGPSLDKNIEELKRAKGRGFIIACDTAVKPLLAHGIKPDLYALVDGLKPLHLVQAEGTEDIPLLTSVTAAHSFLDHNKAKKIFYNEGEIFINHMFHTQGKTFDGMPCGGSVATSAFAFAYLIGMKNIVLVGQDLALSGRYVHAQGTFEKSDDIAEEDGTYLVDGNYEEKVRTRSDFDIYRKWFEYYIEGCQEYEPEFRVINATEGGAKIKFTEIKTLKETIDELCTQEINIKEAFDKIEPAFTEEEQKVNMKYLMSMPEQFQEIAVHAKELQTLYRRVDKLAKVRNMDLKAYKKALKKIEKTTKEIDKHTECMSHISETLKVADFILKSEANLKLLSFNEEALEISRQGMLYAKLLQECAELFAEMTKEIYIKE